MVGRVADAVVLSEDERRFLEGQVRRHKAPRSLSDRCRMILLCAEGLPSKEVAAQLGMHEHTVGKWRRRFVKDRIEGLTDGYRPGRPRTVSDAQVADVIERTLNTTPNRPRSFHSPCASHAPAVAAPCASSRSSGEARNRCRVHHPGSRRHDTSAVVCQKAPPVAHRRHGTGGVRLSSPVTTRLPENARFKIAIEATEQDQGRLKHLAQLPPPPRRNGRPKRSHSFTIADQRHPAASSFRGLSTRGAPNTTGPVCRLKSGYSTVNGSVAMILRSVRMI
jgi:Winged helix-turn helix